MADPSSEDVSDTSHDELGDSDLKYIEDSLRRRVLLAPKELRRKLVGMGPAEVFAWQEGRSVFAYAGSTVSVTKLKRAGRRHASYTPNLITTNPDTGSAFLLRSGLTGFMLSDLTLKLGHLHACRAEGDNTVTFIDVGIDWTTKTGAKEHYVLSFLCAAVLGPRINRYSVPQVLDEAVASAIARSAK